MYARLCEGNCLNKTQEAEHFGVDERSIQRDIDDLRAFLSEHQSENDADKREIVYSREKKGFVMLGVANAMMSNAEVLAVSKILLESRAFTKKEVGIILDKLIKSCVPVRNMKLVSDLISNEKYHYVELRHKSAVENKLWELGEQIKEQNLLEIIYKRQVDTKDTVVRVIEPVAVIFSEYYFYLNAYIMQKNDDGSYEKKYSYPAIFRLDRIKKYCEIGEKFHKQYNNRFEEGEFRKRIQFMFAGELERIQFRYTGRSIDAILDRLPTAKIIHEDDVEYIIEAEVYGRGILMWLLSQGEFVEVLKPQSVRDEMRKKLQKMLKQYE